jgi:hypothetical protein
MHNRYISKIIIVLESSYRAEALNNLIFRSQICDIEIVTVVAGQSSIPELEAYLRSIGVDLNSSAIVYSDNAVPESNGTRIWWNTISEVPLDKKVAKNLFTVQNFNEKSQHLQLWPSLLPNIKLSTKEPLIVNVSGIDPPSGKLALLYPHGVSDSVFTKFRTSEYWSSILTSENPDYKLATELFLEISIYFRHKYVRFLRERYKSRFILGGRLWNPFNLDPIDVRDAKTRRSLYSGNICINFGSYSAGNTAIYSTPIEIIESGGLLIIPRTNDAIEILPHPLLPLITYKTEEELSALIDQHSASPDLMLHTMTMLNEFISEKEPYYDRMFLAKVID